ncbi:uncharacterized protein MYCFIDRAFT_209360 [Pseudocercospora fijiensis CIRAD86]|uniref:Uncharacterized protein n=1 Tax=Pseudocercospora fijiensis (strain CIRAD86) TaxID=383855 RepID=M3AHQ6_PSEFD|nr:uncharacterized protein MYCFIDRAFT_209360 [Pseudocercospora fijiensis CIRAD86]EME77047.1 hypothetical protein MYCFIDRAFT_209360 [Pseudocercospora fijiensis CIRAD86]
MGIDSSIPVTIWHSLLKLSINMMALCRIAQYPCSSRWTCSSRISKDTSVPNQLCLLTSAPEEYVNSRYELTRKAGEVESTWDLEERAAWTTTTIAMMTRTGCSRRSSSTDFWFKCESIIIYFGSLVLLCVKCGGESPFKAWGCSKQDALLMLF